MTRMQGTRSEAFFSSSNSNFVNTANIGGLSFSDAWISGLILGLHPANERRCYFVTTSLIGWAQA